MFATLMAILKEFFEKVDFEKSADNKKYAKLPSRQRGKCLFNIVQ